MASRHAVLSPFQRVFPPAGGGDCDDILYPPFALVFLGSLSYLTIEAHVRLVNDSNGRSVARCARLASCWTIRCDGGRQHVPWDGFGTPYAAPHIGVPAPLDAANVVEQRRVIRLLRVGGQRITDRFISGPPQHNPQIFS